ncbi:tRNA (adenosine(37)-N6)-dimethylallyltransferase MiaA [Flammeovirga agarivorans]|uniref:tRNA dimethylallyltransferase n=1 Tax=Flammeovirga agarivorans TaxID=2726742 RepID=A0A7X8SLW0_9BACT|nr:tRNA (adenosine(37)-N6)-dimethylallyltransferase MiaA [Flammeovirga agarivorans]NLR92560.1 tRNA (adenosine(37)-N6)-dimethylallyltransferase MiaA [Flammeovirga agarivorans]
MSQEKSLNNTPLIVITGPTASGKTSLATHLSSQIGGEVISADSRQVFKGMDIGTGKDLSEYKIKGKDIPYHLIDICEPGEDFNLYLFQKLYAESVDTILKNNHIPILCGGTGLYIEAVTLDGYDEVWIPRNEALRSEWENQSLEDMQKFYLELVPNKKKQLEGIGHRARSLMRAIEIEYFLKYKPETHYKPVEFKNLPTFNFAINIDRDTRWSKIERRLNERLEEGMIDEVKSLLERIESGKLKSYGLEYRHITEYLEGEITYDEMREVLLKSIQQFSKRQMTWFRRMEKKTKINWMPVEWELERKIEFVKATINSSSK